MKEPTVYGDILLVPLGVEGHVSPFMYLARRILERGLTCTLILEEQGAGPLKHNFNKYGKLESSDGFHVKIVETLEASSVPDAVNKWGLACDPAFEELLQRKRDGGKIPACMVVDQFAFWTNRWAKELAMPRYVFNLSAATYAYWMFRYSDLIEKDKVLERVDEDPVLDLPGAPEIRLSEASTSASRAPHLFTSNGNTFDDAAGILINTFYDVEKSVIDNFHSQLDSPVRGGAVRNGWSEIKVLPIGPIPPPPPPPRSGNGDGDGDVPLSSPLARPENDSACIRWLDSRPPHSVVYIAFGSLAALPVDQVKELAAALEATNVSFLWILLTKKSGDGVQQSAESLEEVAQALPPRFQERIGDRGLVHPFFAPQLHILEHPAVGAFLTHCGWNSALESICRGVPLIGWPRASEQLLSCRVLVDAGVAARIRPEITRESDLLSSGELETALRSWRLDGPGIAKLRERALELQQRAREAVAPGGSSYQNFESFIQRYLPETSS